MDWFKAIMIFIIISFGGVLVYVCATLENLITEYGNLKAQIETLNNRYLEAMRKNTDNSNRLDMVIDDFDSRFEAAWGICTSTSDLVGNLILRLNTIEDAMENRAKESSEVFEAVRNDILMRFAKI